MGIKVGSQKPFVFQKATDTQTRKDYTHLFPTLEKPYALYKNDRWKARITYVEPACVESYKTKALDAVPQPNLDALLSAEEKRRAAKIPLSPKSKMLTPSSKKELAASAVNRGDPQLDLFLHSDMAKAFNIDAQIKSRLTAAVEKEFPDKLTLASHWLFISKIVDFFLLNIGMGKISSLLKNELKSLDPKLAKIIRKELLKIRKELREILGSKYEFSRDNSFNGKSYYDKDGKLVLLTATVASDVDNDTLVMGRNVFSKQGKLVCTTGRPESPEAAKEQAKLAFLGKLKERLQAGLPPPANGQPFYYVINTFLNSTVLGNHGKHKEEIRLRNEVHTLKDLAASGEILEVEHEGIKYTFTPQPILLPKSMNPLGVIDEVIGKEPPLAQEIRKENYPKFEALVQTRIENLGLDPETEDFVHDCMIRLEKGSMLKPHQELFLRDLVCKLLDIPPVYQCAHSKDRTALAVMNSSALQQWMDLSEWLGHNKLDNIPSDPLELLNDYRFKDLAFGDAMLMHQVSSFALAAEGTAGGEQLDNDKMGFNTDLPKSPVTAEIFPRSELKTISPVKRAVMGFFGWTLFRPLAVVAYFAAWLCRIIHVGILGGDPESIPALDWITSFNPLQAGKIIWHLDKLYLRPGVNEDSPFVKDNHLFMTRKKSKPRIADDVKGIVKAIENASISKLTAFLSGKQTKLTKNEQQLLADIASNFEQLKRVRDNKDFTNPKLKTLMAACEKSEIALFKLAHYANGANAEKLFRCSFSTSHQEGIDFREKVKKENLIAPVIQGKQTIKVSLDLYKDLDRLVGDIYILSDGKPHMVNDAGVVKKQLARKAAGQGLKDEEIDQIKDQVAQDLHAKLKLLPSLQGYGDQIPLAIQSAASQGGFGALNICFNQLLLISTNNIPYFSGLFGAATDGTLPASVDQEISEDENGITFKYIGKMPFCHLDDLHKVIGFLSFNCYCTLSKKAGSESWEEKWTFDPNVKSSFAKDQKGNYDDSLFRSPKADGKPWATEEEFKHLIEGNKPHSLRSKIVKRLQILSTLSEAKKVPYREEIKANLVELHRVSAPAYAALIAEMDDAGAPVIPVELHLPPLPPAAPVVAAPAAALELTLKGRLIEWCKDFGSGLERIISPRSIARVLVRWDKNRLWRLTAGRAYAVVLFLINAANMVVQAAKIALIKPILRIVSIIPPAHNYFKKKEVVLGMRGLAMDTVDLLVLVKRSLQNLWDVAFGLQPTRFEMSGLVNQVTTIQDNGYFGQLLKYTKREAGKLVDGEDHKLFEESDRLSIRTTKELLVPFRPVEITRVFRASL